MAERFGLGSAFSSEGLLPGVSSRSARGEESGGRNSREMSRKDHQYELKKGVLDNILGIYLQRSYYIDSDDTLNIGLETRTQNPLLVASSPPGCSWPAAPWSMRRAGLGEARVPPSPRLCRLAHPLNSVKT